MPGNTTSRTAIVIPTYNEKDNIRKMIFAVTQMFPQMRLFVVDDNSPDGTARVVQELAGRSDRVRLIFRDRKQGLASAYLDAFARLLPDETISYIVTMDADFSHHPGDLPGLLAHLGDHDLVVGSRYVARGSVENWAWHRKLISKYANGYARLVTGVPVYDLTAGFVVYRRELLARILVHEIKSDAYGYQIEMKYLAHALGARIKEVPITFRERASGKSKFGWKSVWEGIVAPWYLRLYK